MPRYNWHDPVTWRRREHNKRADHLANVTMDRRKNWTTEYPWPYGKRGIVDCNLVMHSDGGARPDCAASAWIIEAGLFYCGGWCSKVLAMGGIFMEPAVSSFTAESIALETALQHVKTIIRP